MRIGFAGFVVCFVFAAFSSDFSASPNKTSFTSENSLGNFYQSVADYFKASQRELQFAKDSKLPDEEIPVVYFISRTASVNVEEVVNLRTCGLQWADIAKYYGLDAKIFDCKSKDTECNKHGYKVSAAKNRKRNSWKKYSDKEIINLVNLKFISEDHLCSANYIQKLHKQGSDYVNINQ